jgi:hypothetical protein
MRSLHDLGIHRFDRLADFYTIFSLSRFGKRSNAVHLHLKQPTIVDLLHGNVHRSLASSFDDDLRFDENENGRICRTYSSIDLHEFV